MYGPAFHVVNLQLMTSKLFTQPRPKRSFNDVGHLGREPHFESIVTDSPCHQVSSVRQYAGELIDYAPTDIRLVADADYGGGAVAK
jgi:hypothetical protein